MREDMKRTVERKIEELSNELVDLVDAVGFSIHLDCTKASHKTFVHISIHPDDEANLRIGYNDRCYDKEDSLEGFLDEPVEWRRLKEETYVEPIRTDE